MEPKKYTIDNDPKYGYMSWSYSDGIWTEYIDYSEPGFVHVVPEYEVPIIVRQAKDKDEEMELELLCSRAMRDEEDDAGEWDQWEEGELDPAGGHGLHSHE